MLTQSIGLMARSYGTPGKVDILINKCPGKPYMWKCINPVYKLYLDISNITVSNLSLYIVKKIEQPVIAIPIHCIMKIVIKSHILSKRRIITNKS